jgi:hypothetical protein
MLLGMGVFDCVIESLLLFMGILRGFTLLHLVGKNCETGKRDGDVEFGWVAEWFATCRRGFC